MRKITSFIIFVSGLTFFQMSYSHEGHGTHGKNPLGSESFGPHGGTIQKAAHHLVLELVREGKQKIKLYPLTVKDQKAIPMEEVEIKGRAETPRKGAKDLVFKKEKDHLLTEIDTQGSHRVELKLEVTYKKHKHQVNFPIEPEEGME